MKTSNLANFHLPVYHYTTMQILHCWLFTFHAARNYWNTVVAGCMHNQPCACTWKCTYAHIQYNDGGEKNK